MFTSLQATCVNSLYNFFVILDVDLHKIEFKKSDYK